MKLLSKILIGALCVLLMVHSTQTNMLHRTAFKGDLVDDEPYETDSSSSPVEVIDVASPCTYKVVVLLTNFLLPTHTMSQEDDVETTPMIDDDSNTSFDQSAVYVNDFGIGDDKESILIVLLVVWWLPIDAKSCRKIVASLCPISFSNYGETTPRVTVGGKPSGCQFV
ncbi:hypothetical protein AHF37_00062 [Paragonimus kellicotti]|nr:hypothetical protein AHF37_00062 [Paragonimus kellicotti]